MSSKEDEYFEQKMADEVAKGELTNDMQPIISVKGPTIHFPNETWEEIIMWIKRQKLGEHVSLVNNRFFCLSYTFMHEEKVHRLLNLAIYGGNHEPWMKIKHDYENGDGSVKEVSKAGIPIVEITENIRTGYDYQYLGICGIDSDVLQFVRLLVPIHTDVIVFFLDSLSEEKMSNPEMNKLVQLFGNKIQRIYLKENITFSQFHKHYEFIFMHLVYIGIERAMTEEELDILMNCLYKRMEDQRPIVVWIRHMTNLKFVEKIKEEFLNASKQSSFLLQIINEGLNENLSCNIVNSDTLERLTIQFLGIFVYIARLPQDYSDTPQEIANNEHDSFGRLYQVQFNQ